MCKFKDMESKKGRKEGVGMYGGILVGTASWVSTQINVANIQKSLRERERERRTSRLRKNTWRICIRPKVERSAATSAQT